MVLVGIRVAKSKPSGATNESPLPLSPADLQLGTLVSDDVGGLMVRYTSPLTKHSWILYVSTWPVVSPIRFHVIFVI